MTSVGAARSPVRARLRAMGEEKRAAGLLLIFTLAAILWANSPFGDSYEHLWETELTLALASDSITLTLHEVVNDALMAIFFFVVGLEVKRELTIGELTDRSRAIVPVSAAVAGLVLPAAIFWAFNAGTENAHAWGIVISTDTAFLLGALAIIGPRHPARLRLFLMTLAIVDDIGALAAIALFYNDGLRPDALLFSAVMVALAVGVRFLPGSRGVLYALIGIGLWFGLHEAGIHATLAGVALALIIPVAAPRRDDVEQVVETTRAFRQSPSPAYAAAAARSLRQSISINERLHSSFTPYVSYAILPVFALANAGVRLDGPTVEAALTSRLTWGVVAGLVVGKLVGVTVVTALVHRSGIGMLAPGLTIGRVAGGAALSGIGFTISLLIVGLAIDDPAAQDEARVGVLLASVIAFGLGWVVLASLDRHAPTEAVGARLLRPFDPERDHHRGRPDAPLVMVEYLDFECPFCSRMTGSVDQVSDHFGDDLVWVWRHLPLHRVHPHSQLAAQAAEAAALQGRHLEYGPLLFARQDDLTRTDLLAYAAELGLDLDRFEADLDSAAVVRRVQDDVDDADLMDLAGTPTFFIGTERHSGPIDARSLITALERLRTEAAP
ncbi:Na+/H+ antiporter NhaA [Aeromicrobium marinum DSM 15272]|uniref:Na(+)/H(+) antiporter NhaA n=1 Tax=Aeromicrobium marinum DSM 15272 TaxID=585531 RepID=E2SC38_9ACTN|nr:Na+/H+ antiporter NhaA [Aeromicrobium marinum]EFQ83324.1 Na+/H+ antiporter NhaA [Aeromicrobium marinum DSM 15272]